MKRPISYRLNSGPRKTRAPAGVVALVLLIAGLTLAGILAQADNISESGLINLESPAETAKEPEAVKPPAPDASSASAVATAPYTPIAQIDWRERADKRVGEYADKAEAIGQAAFAQGNISYQQAVKAAYADQAESIATAKAPLQEPFRSDMYTDYQALERQAPISQVDVIKILVITIDHLPVIFHPLAKEVQVRTANMKESPRKTALSILGELSFIACQDKAEDAIGGMLFPTPIKVANKTTDEQLLEAFGPYNKSGPDEIDKTTHRDVRLSLTRPSLENRMQDFNRMFYNIMGRPLMNSADALLALQLAGVEITWEEAAAAYKPAAGNELSRQVFDRVLYERTEGLPRSYNILQDASHIAAFPTSSKTKKLFKDLESYPPELRHKLLVNLLREMPAHY